MRTEAKARRDALGDAVRGAASRALARQLLTHFPLRPNEIVAGYWPLGSEVDVRPVLEGLCRRGLTCALPVVFDPQSPLTFFAWQPGAALVRGRFGVMMPEDQSDPVAPSLVLVPLLAFDLEGYRLGYGGGYYDRTIAELRLGRGCEAFRAIGVAFQAQQVDKVPADLHDQRLDAVVTEAGVHWFR